MKGSGLFGQGLCGWLYVFRSAFRFRFYLQAPSLSEGDVHVVNRGTPALAGGLASEPELQRQAGQSVAGNGFEVRQSGGKRAYGVEAGGAEDKTAQRIILPNHHVQPAIGLAGAALGQWTGVWGRHGRVSMPSRVRRLHCSPSPTHRGLAVCRSNSAYSARRFRSGSLNNKRMGIWRARRSACP